MEHQSKQPQMRFFAAANSAEGFYSYFPSIFQGLSHLYIIKGGSGTGKSHLMREFAARAQERGHRCEFYYCSSDPTSLDGVIVPALRIGILDGTAPHTTDPVYPGVVDEIVNVGDFWDAVSLCQKKEEITALIDQKKSRYAMLYRYLGGASLCADAMRRLIEPYVQTSKLHGAAQRLLREVKFQDGFRLTLRPTEAIGMEGAFAFDTLEQMATVRYFIRDRFDCADLFTDAVLEVAKEKHLCVCASPSPLQPLRLRTLLLNGSGICLTSVCDALLPHRPPFDRVINMDRFLNLEGLRPHKRRLRFLRQCRDAFLQEAYRTFYEIKELHFTLERHYISCMDFERKEAFTKAFLARVFPSDF